MTRPDDDLRTLRDAGVLLRRNHDDEIPQWIRAHARRQAERRHGDRRVEPKPETFWGDFVPALVVMGSLILALGILVHVAAAAQ